MLNQEAQLKFSTSQYSDLYDILIDKENIWRKLNETIDFSFVISMLKDKYSSTMGRKSEDVVRMFKFLLLKAYYNESDRTLVERAKTDLIYKYFLGYDPEEIDLIDPSLLTKFRRERLANKKDSDSADNLLDTLISITVKLAIEKGVIKSKNQIIMDSTHSVALYGHISPREALINAAKELRKVVYSIDESMHDKMPKKKEATGILEDQIEYTKELIKVIENEERFKIVPAIQEKKNLLEEILDDTETELEYSKDQDAKVGHKTADTSFFGYKSHIAMTPERIITGVVITSGEKHDGKQLQELVRKSKENGIEVDGVIGDGAYSEKENIDYCNENDIKLASKLSKFVTHGNTQRNQNFEYNKDAEMYICKAGHMAIAKRRTGSKNDKVESYFFDVEKCKHCPYKEGCYQDGAKTKTYNVRIKDDSHIAHMDYMKTEEFKNLYSERYKIEAKNAELKNNYGYDKATAVGKIGITIQGATTLFMSNIKRIFKLTNQK